MKLYAGLISLKAKEAVIEGAISQHIVCGVDIYKNSEAAEEDGDKLDYSKSCPFSERGPHFAPVIREKYFSSKYFTLIDILEEDDPITFTDVLEVRAYMLENEIGVFGILKKETLEMDEEDISYVLSPLTKQELRELMNWRND